MVHMEHMGFPGARSCWYLELWDLQIPGVSLDFHLLRSRLPNALAYKRWRLADGQPQGGRRRVATYLWLLLSCLEERRSQRACGRQSARARNAAGGTPGLGAHAPRSLRKTTPQRRRRREREGSPIHGMPHTLCIHIQYTPCSMP
jgi:hypothetical protein